MFYLYIYISIGVAIIHPYKTFIPIHHDPSASFPRGLCLCPSSSPCRGTDSHCQPHLVAKAVGKRAEIHGSQPTTDIFLHGSALWEPRRKLMNTWCKDVWRIVFETCSWIIRHNTVTWISDFVASKLVFFVRNAMKVSSWIWAAMRDTQVFLPKKHGEQWGANQPNPKISL